MLGPFSSHAIDWSWLAVQVKYWLEKGKGGFLVYKYLLRRRPNQGETGTERVEFGGKSAPKGLSALTRPGVYDVDISCGKEAKPVRSIAEAIHLASLWLPWLHSVLSLLDLWTTGVEHHQGTNERIWGANFHADLISLHCWIGHSATSSMSGKTGKFSHLTQRICQLCVMKNILCQVQVVDVNTKYILWKCRLLEWTMWMQPSYPSVRTATSWESRTWRATLSPTTSQTGALWRFAWHPFQTAIPQYQHSGKTFCFVGHQHCVQGWCKATVIIMPCMHKKYLHTVQPDYCSTHSPQNVLHTAYTQTVLHTERSQNVLQSMWMHCTVTYETVGTSSSLQL